MNNKSEHADLLHAGCCFVRPKNRNPLGMEPVMPSSPEAVYSMQKKWYYCS